MDLTRDQQKILEVLRQSDSESDDECQQQHSDSESEDNVQEEVHIITDESEVESQYSSDEEVSVVRRGRNRNNIIESDSDNEPPQRASSSHLSNSSSRHTFVIHPGKNYLYGKNKYKWMTNPRGSSTRTSARNITHFIPGPVNGARDITKPNSIFKLFLSDEMIDQIVTYTNAEIDLKKDRYKQLSHTISYTTSNEMRALIGLLFQSAVVKSSHLPTRVLFDTKKSGNIFKAAMSAERFDFLLRCCRFDDRATRQERKASDKFAPIREFWENFINNCRDSYKPSSYVTIDEQLVGFRGRCPFRMYMPNKPNKYGIKIVMVADSNSRYVFNAMPYLGKGTNSGNMPLATYFVKQLCEPLNGTNRNITMDNWFTSVPLASELLQSPYKLTIVGTLRSNKREIPLEMKNSKTRKIGTSMFAFDAEKILVSYKPKSNKVVYLLSTAHDQPDINSDSKKPEVIHFYNSTKGAVDTVDQMCTIMSCSRKTNRWPLCVFYNILNLCMVNMYVVYVSNIIKLRQKPLKRRDFVQQLVDELCEPWLHERFNTVTLRRDIRGIIKSILKIQDNVPSTSQPRPNKRKICAFCPYQKHRMTKFACHHCGKAICGEHTVQICNECVE